MSSNAMDPEVARLLSEGQDAARRGDRAMARTLLTQLVEKDPHNEEAWMWLSGVVTDPGEQQICLENALVINPYNAQARKGLEFIAAKTGTPMRVPPVPPDPTSPAPPVFDESLFKSAGADPRTENGAPAPQVPESWAVPGPESANSFLDGAPFPPAPGPTGATSHGYPGANGAATELAGTVPYTAPEPGPSDFSFAQSGTMEPRSSGGLSGMGAGSPNGYGSTGQPGDPMQAAGMSFGGSDPGFDAQPFVPPGLNDQPVQRAHEDTATDLPSWLENLTPSVPANETHEPEPFSPYNMPGFNSGPGLDAANPMNGMNGMNAMNGAPAVMGGQVDPNMPFGAPGQMPPAHDMPPMSPFSDIRLPSPGELPGADDGMGGSTQAQPWYLQGSTSSSNPQMPTGGISSYLDSTVLTGGKAGAAVLEQNRSKTGATIQCPNCKEHVPDTSLACPNCQYNFFVNCPYCHELVDTADAVAGQVEPCPYCKQSINRMELGMGGVQDLVSQKNPGSRPAAAAAMTLAFPEMQQDIPGLKRVRRGFTFDWVIDLLWLIAVVMMVWALTQLPTWLNLPGMY